MKKLLRSILIVPVVALALTAGGCANVQNAWNVATSTFTNPVTPTNLYEAKIVFERGQSLVLKYQRDCFGSQTPPYPVSYAMIQADPVLHTLCSHRVSRYRAMKKAEGIAYNALGRADTFIAENPTGNAASYISAAIKAVLAYQAKAKT